MQKSSQHRLGFATMGVLGLTFLLCAGNAQALNIQFQNSSMSVAENAGPLQIPVIITGGTGSSSVTAHWTVTGGTAVYNTNYSTNGSGTSGFVNASDFTIGNIQINPVHDFQPGATKTLILTLSNPNTGTIGSPATCTINILDVDTPPKVSFSSATYTTPITQSTANFVVQLSQVYAQDVTVNYSVGGGSALNQYPSNPNGDYYLQTPGQVTIPAGQTQANVTVSNINSNFNSNTTNITIVLNLTATNHGAIQTPATATMTIIKSPPTVQFSASSYTVLEAETTFNVTVTLSNAYNKVVTVGFTTVDGTAKSPTQYNATNSTLVGNITFNPGEVSKTIAITIHHDGIGGGTKSFGVNLTGTPTNATFGAVKSTTVNITDIDVTPTVKFSSATYSVQEGAGFITVTMTLSQATSGNVFVNLSTGTTGTAIPNTNYTPLTNQQINFPPGTLTQTYNIQILADHTPTTPNRTFSVILSAAVNANLGSPSTAIVTIIDTDTPPAISFTATNYNVDEAAGVSNAVIVQLSRVYSQDITVPISIGVTGSAQIGTDYTTVGSIFGGGTSGTLTIPKNTLFVTVPITIVDNATADNPNKFFIVTLSSNGITPIIDNDTPRTVSFFPGSYSVVENAGVVTITAKLSQASLQSYSVDYKTADLSAIAGQDYVATQGTLTFPPVATTGVPTAPTVSFTVAIINDTIPEPIETFKVNLSTPTNNLGILGGQATVNILDNDPATITVIATQPNAAEGGASGTFQLTRSGSTAAGLVVNFTMTGSATSSGVGQDYILTGTTPPTGTTTVTFAPGQTNANVTLAPIDDAVYEGYETATFNIAPGAGYFAGSPASATILIADNEPPPPSISVSVPDPNACAATSNTGTIRLTRTSTLQAITVNLTFTGTAPGGDYSLTNATTTSASFGAGQSFVDVTITGTNIAQVGSETVTLNVQPTILTPVDYVVGAPSSGTVTLVDNTNDNAPVLGSTLTIIPNPVVTGGKVTFFCPASDPDGDPLTFTWTFGDGNTAVGNPVTHTYATPGTKGVFVDVSDGVKNTTSATTNVTVSNTGTLNVNTLSLFENFISANMDQANASGTFGTVPATFAAAGATASLSIGGSAPVAFTLDQFGSGRTALGSLQIHKSNGQWSFSAALLRSGWKSTWQAGIPLQNGNYSNAPRSVVVNIVVNGVTFTATVPVKYTARLNISGMAQ